MTDKKILRVGLIGLGEISQVSHISVLNALSDYYQITYLCHASPESLNHCSKRINPTPKTTENAEELIASPDVDVVFVCSINTFHPSHTILALQHDKYVLVEKPAALNYRDIDAMIAAEKDSKAKAFVAYQRRYATAFLDAVKEVGGLGKIHYARVRDIIGPNHTFVSQSTTYPRSWTDFGEKAESDMKVQDEEMVKEALIHDCGIKVTPELMDMVRLLGGLGSHDLSAMREIIGMPKHVVGTSIGNRFWSVLFQYEGFPVTYESGINDVPVFDAHIEIYGHEKIVRVDYDTPYVKGLPVTMTIREKIDTGNAPGYGYQERMVRKTYEDPYTLEFLDFHECVTRGKSPKTSLVDAKQDLDLIKLILQAGSRG